LPSTVFYQIISLCRNFIWSGNILPHHQALVAWKTVCLSKIGGKGCLTLKLEIEASWLSNYGMSIPKLIFFGSNGFTTIIFIKLPYGMLRFKKPLRHYGNRFSLLRVNCCKSVEDILKSSLRCTVEIPHLVYTRQLRMNILDLKVLWFAGINWSGNNGHCLGTTWCYG
jgi:hypothetical protein